MLQTVYIVDDDTGVRNSLKWLLESVSLNVQCYANAKDFLDEYKSESTGCLVLDIRMPVIGGLDLQRILKKKLIEIPIIFVTAHADVPTAIQAMKQGAFDFVEKPYSDQILLERIQAALEVDLANQNKALVEANIRHKFNHLTSRENEVLSLILNGKLNKEIAKALNLSTKTVEAHRSNLFRKLEVSGTSELFHLAAMAKLI